MEKWNWLSFLLTVYYTLRWFQYYFNIINHRPMLFAKFQQIGDYAYKDDEKLNETVLHSRKNNNCRGLDLRGTITEAYGNDKTSEFCICKWWQFSCSDSFLFTNFNTKKINDNSNQCPGFWMRNNIFTLILIYSSQNQYIFYKRKFDLLFFFLKGIHHV